MKKEDLLFLIVASSVLIARLSVAIFPNVDIYILGLNFHHFWLGLIVLLLSLFLVRAKSILGLIVFGFGLGLMIDQLVFMILGGGSDIEYWSYTSIAGTLLLVIMLFISKERSARRLGTL